MRKEKPYQAKKITSFTSKHGPHNITDFCIDFEHQIAYALTDKGDILSWALYTYLELKKNNPTR